MDALMSLQETLNDNTTSRVSLAGRELQHDPRLHRNLGFDEACENAIKYLNGRSDAFAGFDWQGNVQRQPVGLGIEIHPMTVLQAGRPGI